MLVQQPTMVSSRPALESGLRVPQDVERNDVAVTTRPAFFRTPLFSINCQQRQGNRTARGWFATLQIDRRADEGINIARYLGPGLYSTELMYDAMGNLGPYIAGGGNRRVYVEIDNAMAALNRHAELEHCLDIIRAYSLTLNAAQTALDTAQPSNPFGPYDKRDAAMRAVRAAIVAGLHQRIAAIFRRTIPDMGSVNRPQFEREMSQLYLDTCDQSQQQRDALGFHTFRPDATGESWSVRSWAEYAGRRIMREQDRQGVFGEQKDIRRLVRGPNFTVPGPLSAAVINL
jgi:hypothetical protein